VKKVFEIWEEEDFDEGINIFFIKYWGVKFSGFLEGRGATTIRKGLVRLSKNNLIFSLKYF